MQQGEGKSENKSAMTIHDVARELGVSASTVSRAISGKGRIGEETRQRVLQFINENGFYPNATARSLAQSKTYNIAIVLPQVKDLVDMPFFHTCMHGAEEVAQANDYDLLVVTTDGSSKKVLERMVNNRKVDGVILTRTYEKDTVAEYLKQVGMPFVTVGSSQDPDVFQVDHDNIGACRELVSDLLERNIEHIAYLGGNMDQMVNLSRFGGYRQAHESKGKALEQNLIRTDLQEKQDIESAVDALLQTQADCLLCQDDFICDAVIRRLAELEVDIPGKMMVASCHHSRLLDNYPVTITSIRFDIMEIGRKACQVLLDEINGEATKRKTMLDYEISINESTNRNE